MEVYVDRSLEADGSITVTELHAAEMKSIY